jgi:hypothetical protein
MRVNEDKYFYFLLNKHKSEWEEISRQYANQHPEDSPESKEERRKIANEIFTTSGFKDYVFSAEAQQKASEIEVGDNFPYDYFVDCPVQRATFVLSKRTFTRYIIHPDTRLITVAFIHLSHDLKVAWHVFRIDMDTNEAYYRSEDPKEWKMVNKMMKDYARCMMYVFYSEQEYKVIEAGRKIGTKKTGRVKNETPRPFTYITADWNVTKIRNAPIKVRQFIRLQACGENWSKRKPVLIREHIRKGRISKRNKSR